MTSMNIPNSLTNGTTADATDVQQNFDHIESHVNTEVVNRDGSIAMTGELLLPSNPTSNLAAATKSYVDLEATTRENADTALDTRVTALEGTDITVEFDTGSDLDGSFTITNLGNVVNTTVSVRNDSHTHDGRYFTETEADARFLGISAKAADSDKLDTLNSSQFLRSDADDSTTGTLTVGGTGKYLKIKDTVNNTHTMTFATADMSANRTITFPNASGTVALTSDFSGASVNYATSAGNAGTLDNIDSSQFVRSDADDALTGRYTFSRTQSSGDWTQAQIIIDNSGGAAVALRQGSDTATVQLRSGSSPISGRGQLYLRSHNDGSNVDVGFADAFTSTGYMYVSNSANKVRIKSDATGYPWAELECGVLGVNGSVWVNGGQVHSSSRNIKHDIAPIGAGALDLINRLEPVNYRYNSDPSDLRSGFIAEDLEVVLPDAVMRHEDKVGIEQSSLLATVVAAVQELSAQVAALSA